MKSQDCSYSRRLPALGRKLRFQLYFQNISVVLPIVTKSKFQANWSKGSLVMIGYTNKQTNKLTEITTLYIYTDTSWNRIDYEKAEGFRGKIY